MRNLLIIISILIGGQVSAQRLTVQLVGSSGNLLKLYPLYFNPYKIALDGYACNDIMLKGDGYEIRKDKNCYYFIKIHSEHPGNYIYVWDVNKNKMLDSIPAQINYDLPIPSIIPADIKNPIPSQSSYRFDSLKVIGLFSDCIEVQGLFPKVRRSCPQVP